MRKKKKNLPMILAIVVGILALALVTFGRYMISASKNKAVETEKLPRLPGCFPAVNVSKMT